MSKIANITVQVEVEDLQKLAALEELIKQALKNYPKNRVTINIRDNNVNRFGLSNNA